MNYYDELIDQINKLINENKVDEAIKIIEIELAMPYIPKQYENEINKIYKNIKKNTKKENNLSKEEIINLFLNFEDKNENKNNDFLFDLSQIMINYNWFDYVNEIQIIFNKNNINSNVKANIYNVLSLQNVNHNFLIKNKLINPLKDKTIYETDFAINNFNKLDKKMINEPNLIEISKKNLMFYLLNQFPESLFFSYEDISNDLIQISNLMLGKIKKSKLTTKQKNIYKIIKLDIIKF